MVFFKKHRDVTILLTRQTPQQADVLENFVVMDEKIIGSHANSVQVP